MKSKKDFISLGLLYFLFSVFLLIVFFKIDGRSVLQIFRASSYNYFELLADAFIHGRLNIIPKGEFVHDLSIYKDKYYPYWPPMPAITLMPLVYLFGSELPSKLVSIGFASINFVLFLNLTKAFLRYFKLELPTHFIILLGIFWSVGTVNFNVSYDGSVWYLSQVMSQTFILASFLCIFRTNPLYLLSGVFFGMAVYTRNTMVFVGLVYLVLIYQMSGSDLKKMFPKLILFGTPFVVFSFLNLGYNYLRFENPLDNGLTKHNMGWWFKESFEKYGYFNLHFFPKNFYFEILKPPTLLNKMPFIGFDLEGFGMLWASPLFIILPVAVLALSPKTQLALRQVAWASFIAIIPISMMIFMIMGRGVQFGARYSLDYYILLFFGLIFVFCQYKNKANFKIISYALVVLSVLVNIIGAYYMSLR